MADGTGNILTGNGIYSYNSNSGNGIVSDGDTTTTGYNYVGQNAGTNTFTVDKDGVINGTQFKLAALNTAPSSSTDTGTSGEIRYTTTHIYVCTATNTWVRTALSTW